MSIFLRWIHGKQQQQLTLLLESIKLSQNIAEGKKRLNFVKQ